MMQQTNTLRFFTALVPGCPTQSARLTVFPLFAEDWTRGPACTPLPTALARGDVTVSEVDEAGSVPQLRTCNDSDTLVFGLDGEELAGAKQNRALNTSVLLEQKSETLIPVSCTERGRWAYKTRAFSASAHMMSSTVRMSKIRSVTDSVRRGQRYRSDQGDVWRGIDDTQRLHGVCSATDALQDVYEAHADGLDALTADFSHQPEQVGLMVFVDDQFVGMDVFAAPELYATYHDRLVRSFALDALAGDGCSGQTATVSADDATAVLGRVSEMAVAAHPSVGLGEQLRGTAGPVTATALVHDDAVMHAAAFAQSE
jgi:hypothetical protein